MPRPVTPPFAEYRLPPGRHGIPGDQVSANQRWRLLGACAEVLAERGYGGLTVAAVTRSAAVSKATFYRQFEGGLRECILATYEMATQNAIAASRDGCQAAPHPDDVLPVAIASVLELLASEPALAHVLTDQALNDVPGLPGARAEFAERCASLLSRARKRSASDPGRGPGLSLHLVRATKGWLSLRLNAGTAAGLPARAPELTRMLTG